MEPVHQLEKISIGNGDTVTFNLQLTTRVWRNGAEFSAARNFDMDTTILELSQQMAYQEIQVQRDL